MTEVDLGRSTSDLLVEVRTVLSRAETALNPRHNPNREPGDWIKNAKIQDPNGVEGGWVFSDTKGRVVYQDPDLIPHPDRDEIRAALEKVVELLSPWRRTGRPKK